MKLLILSDSHLEFEPFEPPQKLDFDVVLLAGDIHSPGRRAVEWAREHFADTSVIYVSGNHEYYDTRIDLALADARAAALGGWVHLLDCDEVVIGCVRFLGATLWDGLRARHRDARRSTTGCLASHEESDQPSKRLHPDPDGR